MSECSDERLVQIQCEAALHIAHAFVHGDLPESSAMTIRQHLMACEECLDAFDVEAFMSEMIRRSCCQPISAPASLRARIVQMHVAWTE